MGDFPGVLLAIGFVLTLITLVGHGIWLAVAWILRGGKPAEKLLPCIHCGQFTPHGLRYCTGCGRDLHSQLAAELHDLEVFERQLRRLARAGTIGQPELESMLAGVAAYRRRLLHSDTAAPTPRPAAQPAASPPVVPAAAEFVCPEIVDESGEYPVAVEPPVVRPVAAKPQAVPPIAPQATRPAPQAIRPALQAARPAPQPVQLAPPRPVPPAPPRKSWNEMLAGFMEERNIRWGELIGGLLIVGPAIALVISFWEKLEENPYLQLTTFVSICSAVFGAGLYAHHRWRLRSTSLGLLIIATLLVPLNFLAMAAVWKEDFGPGVLAADAVSLGIFFGLTALAGRVLTPGRHWLQVLAVLGGSAGVIVAAQCVAPDASDWWYTTAACLPVACFAAAVLGAVLGGCGRTGTGPATKPDNADKATRGAGPVPVLSRRWSAPRRLDEAAAAELFTLLGTGAFALAVAIGVFVERAIRAGASLDRLSLSAALAAVPILAGGLTVRRGVARDVRLGAWHAAGTLVALLGAVVTLVAIGLAWPQPAVMIAVAAVECAVLAAAAFYWRLPLLHAGAVAFGTIAYLLCFHAIYSGLPLLAADESELGRRIIRLLFHGSTATALCGVFVLCAAASEWLAIKRRRHHAAVYLGACGVLAALGLSLITVRGVETAGDDALRAAILYGVFGALGLLLAARWRKIELSYAGLSLLAAVPLWALRWHPTTHDVGPLWAAVLAGEALAMAVLGVVLRWRSSPESQPATTLLDGKRREAGLAAHLQAIAAAPLLHLSELLAPVAILLATVMAWEDRAAIAAEHSLAPIAAAACLAALYLLQAWVQRSAERTWAGSSIVLVGLIHTFVCNYTEWLLQPWLTALLIHSTLAMLAGLALEAWSARGKAPANRHALPAKIVGRSLLDSAVASSVLALPLLPFVPWEHTASLAACLYWLAAVWLVMAWRRGNAILFAAHQAMLAVATTVAATAWLKEQSWVQRLPNDLLHPQSLQAYGIALGLLSLLWVVVRILWRSGIKGTAPFSLERKLPEVEGDSPILAGAQIGRVPGVDWLLRHALTWLQLLPLVLYLLPSVNQEFVRGFRVGDRLREMQTATCGDGAWWLLAVLAAAWVASSWDRWRDAELLDGFALLAAMPLLIAGRFADDVAVASALRWGLAATFVIGSIAVWSRGRLARACRAVQAKIETGPSGPLRAQTAILATSALPVLLLTVVAAAIRLGGTHAGGPAAETFFDRLGPSVSYLVPLLLVTAGLVGFALRESSAVYAFAGGLVAELTVALGYALHVVTGEDFHGTFTTGQQAALLQLVTITAAAWALGWLIARRWVNVWREDDEGVLPTPAVGTTPTSTWLMRVQLGMGVTGNVVLLCAALSALTLLPPLHHAWPIAAGELLGWIAVATAAAAVAFRMVETQRHLHPHLIGLVGLASIGLLACTVRGAAFEYDFHSASGYRTLMLGWAAYALLIACAAWWTDRVLIPSGVCGRWPALVDGAAAWVRVAGILAVLMGLKAAAFHPLYEDLLWSAAAVALAGGAAATMALWQRRETWAVAAFAAMNLAVSLITWYCYREAQRFDDWWPQLVQINVVCLAVCSMAWSLPRILGRPCAACMELDGRVLPLSHLTAVASVTVPVVLVTLGVAADVFRLPPLRLPVEPLNWIALGAAASAVAVGLWDRTARFVPAALYAAGLAAVGTALCASQLSPRGACWRAGSDLSASVLVAGLLGWLLPRLRPAWQRLRIPDEPQRWPDDWFHGVQATLIAAAAALCAWLALDPAFDAIGRDFALLGLYGRMNGGAGALMLLGATILMAWQTTAQRRTNWQYAAFAAGVLFSSTNTWARLDTAAGTFAGDQPWLHRSAALMIAAGTITLLSALGLRLVLPQRSDWLAAGRRVAPVLGGAMLVMLSIVLAQEAYLFEPNEGAPVARWVIVAVGVALLGAIIACLALALDSSRETPRTETHDTPNVFAIDGRVYVYAAEVLLALAVLHVRLTMPWLFHFGFMKTYWILIVMGVAFCAVGLSELFHRRRLPVLAEPLERTALLLPIAPAVGFWFTAKTDAAAWFIGGGSPAAWFLIGLFYGLMAVHKRSLPLAALGIAAGNAGLWVLWQQCGLSFLDRPQLWIIPLALAALVAEHLDRRRLSAEQRAAIRYLALSAIYVSSTTEFWRGIGASVVLPLITILLSVLGMLAGILLRVRSFLYLGVTFLLVVIARMIFYAAFERGHVWVFWASCIVLGAAIIGLFAVFEKRRNDVLAALERFKKWEG